MQFMTVTDGSTTSKFSGGGEGGVSMTLPDGSTALNLPASDTDRNISLLFQYRNENGTFNSTKVPTPTTVVSYPSKNITLTTSTIVSEDGSDNDYNDTVATAVCVANVP